MITLTNDSSGELLIANGAGPSVRLSREAATRLILHARMHSVADFVAGLPKLISDPEIIRSIAAAFETAPTSSERWNLKEKFARLRTLTKDYSLKGEIKIVEKISL